MTAETEEFLELKIRNFHAENLEKLLTKHNHSGIKFLTPAERHSGKSNEILANRAKVYESAKAAHPERWNGRSTRNWDNIEEVYLNPDKKYEETTTDVDNQEAKAS